MLFYSIRLWQAGFEDNLVSYHILLPFIYFIAVCTADITIIAGI